MDAAKLRTRAGMRVAAGVLVAMTAVLLNTPHIEPSVHAGTLASRVGSICIVALSLFLVASGVKAIEDAGGCARARRSTLPPPLPKPGDQPSD